MTYSKTEQEVIDKLTEAQNAAIQNLTLSSAELESFKDSIRAARNTVDLHMLNRSQADEAASPIKPSNTPIIVPRERKTNAE